MSKREEPERTELQRQHQEAINRSIDETKDSVGRAVEEAKREAPRYSQTVTDFQNETAEAMREITITFLDAHKEVINSMHLAWTPFAERINSSGYDNSSIGGNINNKNYGMMGMMQPWMWWWMTMSPKDIANMYTRSISIMTDLITASTRMATNMMFAGIEASRATTNYAKYSSREIARITSMTARIFGQNTRETVNVIQEGSNVGTTTGTTTTTGRTAGKT